MTYPFYNIKIKYVPLVMIKLYGKASTWEQKGFKPMQHITRKMKASWSLIMDCFHS